ncbi:MAG TPA: Ig-like domain-containing protein, partial [Gemmatimonadales bacterium]|nr:Ig-like domain-containing protein [Gemmatimonadales bacterium]
MRSRIALLALACCAFPLAAQAPPPPALDKTELIRLLTNPLFAQTEVADVVRRSCLTFHPTERDWADFRSAGASGEVIASAAACESRRATSGSATTAAATEAAAPVTAVAQPAEIVTTAGIGASVRVRLSRGRTPLRGTTLALRGTTALGLSRDASAVTDDSGIAVFRLPVVSRVGTHQFEIRTAGGATFPGQPTVLYSVRPARPSRLRLTPEYIAFRGSDSSATIVAAVTDSLGNPVPGEQVDLNGGIGAPLTAVTDSSGRATFTVLANAVSRGSSVQVRVRGLAPVDMEIAAPAGLSGVNTGFLPIASSYGPVGNSLSEPLIFRARTVQGGPAAGRTVRFRALNARVTPESAVLDSTGRVRVDVVLGVRAGEAAVFASVDSLERVVTLRAEPGPIDSLLLDRNGETINGRAIVVQVGVPFTLRLRARDLYGNETSIDALGQALRAGRARLNVRQQDLQLVNLESADSAVVVTLKAARVGTYQFVIGSGIT